MANEIAVLESINLVEVFEIAGIDSILNAVREEVIHDIPDVSTAKGRKHRISLSSKVVRSKTFLEKEGKRLADSHRDTVKNKIDKIMMERKKSNAYLTALAKEIRQPVTDWEDAEKERIAKHQSAISDMEIIAQSVDDFGSARCLDTLTANLSDLESIEMGDHWEEFAAQAVIAKDKCITELKGHIEARQKYEAEQAELEKLRREAAEKAQKEHEERIAREAAELAKQQAEEAARQEALKVQQEQERKDFEVKYNSDHSDALVINSEFDKAASEARAIAQKEEAERLAKEAAERAESEQKEAIERERRLEAERNEARIRHEQQVKQQAEEAERQRKANVEHRRAVNKEIMSALVVAGLSEDDAKIVITEAAKGLAGRLEINY